MERLARDYYIKIEELIGSLEVTSMQAEQLGFYEGIAAAAELIQVQAALGRKVVFIGNGASAAISSHQATDFWKNGGMKAIAFNDASGLTCISNDFGYEYVFEKPITVFVDSGDILVAISSSGRSRNILLGVEAARAKGAKVITLSGFAQDNPLRKLGDVNFYVPSNAYGHVEILHHSICHCVLDTIIERKSKAAGETITQPTSGEIYAGVQDVASRKTSKPEIETIKQKGRRNKQMEEVGGSRPASSSDPKASGSS